MITSKFNSDRIRLLVTDECNYSCPYCHNEGQFSRKNFIGLEKVKELTEYITKNNVQIRSFTISGGEPTIHKSLPQIISLVRKVTPNISIVTNGELLLPEKIDELANAGLKYIKFGIDSVSLAKTKPQKLKSKSTPTKVLKNLMYAKKILPMSSINTVVSKFNIDKIRESIDFSDTNNISVKFLELIEVHNDAIGVNPFEDTISHNWFFTIYKSINDIVKNVRYSPSVKKFYAETINNNVTIQFSEDFCSYGTCSDLWSRMDARGMLIPCIKKPAIINPKGNLLEGFEKVNSEMKKVEKWPCKNRVEETSIKNGFIYINDINSDSKIEFPLTDQISCAC